MTKRRKKGRVTPLSAGIDIPKKLTWVSFLELLPDDVRVGSIQGCLDVLRESDESANRQFLKLLLSQLAKAVHWQPRTLTQKSTEEISFLLDKHRRHINPTVWTGLMAGLVVFGNTDVSDEYSKLMRLGKKRLEADFDEITPPDPDNLQTTVTNLVDKFGPEIVAPWFLSLYLHKKRPQWMESEARILEYLLARIAKSERGSDRKTSTAELQSQDLSAELTSDFTVLDRVLIDHVVATSSDITGALSPGDVDDLLTTLLHMNAKWMRGHYHRGFANTLLNGAASDSELSGLAANEQRRQWYLAGHIAALIRLDNREALHQALSAHHALLEKAARTKGGPGEAMAKVAFAKLCEMRELGLAQALLAGQLGQLGERLAIDAFGIAERMVLANEESAAEPILIILENWITQLSEEAREHFLLASKDIHRRLAQCLQARGEFNGAEKRLSALLAEPGHADDAELLCDLALVKAKVRHIWDLVIPRSDEDRDNLVGVLKGVEGILDSAIESEESDTTNARFALALLNYLRFSKAPSDELARRRALQHAQDAVAGMQGSRRIRHYQRLGLLGTSLLMSAVLRMYAAEEAECMAAFSEWQQIRGDIVFPKRDLELLLEAAETASPQIALSISEKIWEKHGKDSADLLAKPRYLEGLDSLRYGLLEYTLQDTVDPYRRWTVLSMLVPALYECRDREQALDAFDAMEDIASQVDRAESMADWIRDNESVLDGLLGHMDRVWIQVRAYRRCGRDADAAQCVAPLWFKLRESGTLWEQRELVDYLKAHNLDISAIGNDPEFNALYNGKGISVVKDIPTPAPMTVILVGGNEIQEQHDETLRASLAESHPYVTLSIHRTGWSSNWSTYADDVLKEAKDADAVVMMTMMRTMLGRRVRAGLDVPWISCNARGLAGMKRAIETAILIVADSQS